MEHARKMILVPEESIEKYKKNPSIATNNVHRVLTELAHEIQPTAQTPGDPVSRLDAQLLEILNSKSKDDHEKWKLYNDVLRRYLFYSGKSKEQTAETEESKEVERTPRYDPKVIISSVPITYQRKATGILDHIERVDGGRRLKWDVRGLVTLDGQVVPGAHIVDLIQDAVRERKNYQATGWERFARFLKGINTPREFVGNNKFHRVQVANPQTPPPPPAPPSPAQQSPGSFRTPNQTLREQLSLSNIDQLTAAAALDYGGGSGREDDRTVLYNTSHPSTSSLATSTPSTSTPNTPRSRRDRRRRNRTINVVHTPPVQLNRSGKHSLSPAQEASRKKNHHYGSRSRGKASRGIF